MTHESLMKSHFFLIKTSKNETYRDGKSVAVGDLIVYDGLNVDGFQLEVNGNVDKPG